MELGGLPLEILIKVASCDWIAWAKLALVYPPFSTWAAMPEQIAAFMRTFTVNHFYLSTITYTLDGLYTICWFDYPAIMYTGSYRMEWRKKGIYCRNDGLPYMIGQRLRCWRINCTSMSIYNYRCDIIYTNDATQHSGYQYDSIFHDNHTINSNGSRILYSNSIKLVIDATGACV
jgi:hypothetical protein